MNPIIVKATLGFLIVTQLLFFLIFVFVIEYNRKETPEERFKKSIQGPVKRPGIKKNGTINAVSILQADHLLVDLYPIFQNVHVMIFIGFGFLTTYLKRWGRSSVSFAFLLSSFVIIWYLIIDGLIYSEDKKIYLTLWSIVRAELAAATFLVSFGAVLGKYNILQLYLMAFIETPIYAANRYLVEEVLMAADVGGSTMIHLFGTFFGLGVSLIHGLRGGPKVYRVSEFVKSSYDSDIFAMFGTLILWIFWPCFNAVLTVGPQQSRVIANTYIALASGVISVGGSIIGQALRTKKWKIHMIYVQQGTLAAGVAIAATANIITRPSHSFVTGAFAGALSAFCFFYIQGFLAVKLRMHDTRGVFSFHGAPAFFGGISGAIEVIWATKKQLQSELYIIYPGMNPKGKGRSRGIQAGYQISSIFCSMGLGFVGGVLTGTLIVLAIPMFPLEERYIDEIHWESYENQ